MKKTITYQIDNNTEQQTVEQFLRFHGYSSHLLTGLRHTPMGIAADGQPVYTTHKLSCGELLVVTFAEEQSSENIVPTSMPLDIVYEDEDILVINKAAGVPIHPSQGNFDHTLANGLAFYFKQKQESFVYRAINRLDRDTTGLLILARNSLSACILSDMVRTGSIHRQYLAIADGCIQESGTIEAAIARVDGSTIERCVSLCGGDPACTHYDRILYNPDYDSSLVALKLETGRTHQIRVHLKFIGHPILGDFLYHPDYRYIGRQALHSYKLNFIHPLTGAIMNFTAHLPDDMRFICPSGLSL